MNIYLGSDHHGYLLKEKVLADVISAPKKTKMDLLKKFTSLAAGAVTFSLIIGGQAFAQGNPKLSDAEVASVAVTANQIDIDYATIATRKSKNSSRS